jgi:hypothetical protein
VAQHSAQPPRTTHVRGSAVSGWRAPIFARRTRGSFSLPTSYLLPCHHAARKLGNCRSGLPCGTVETRRVDYDTISWQPRILIPVCASFHFSSQWYSTGTAYTSRVEYTDGTSHLFDRRERPHVVFEENSTRPIALSTAVRPGGQDGDRTFSLVQGLRKATYP